MLLEYIWLLGTFVNSSCDIKINVNIVQNCCRNLAVRGLNKETCKGMVQMKLAQVRSNLVLSQRTILVALAGYPWL